MDAERPMEEELARETASDKEENRERVMMGANDSVSNGRSSATSQSDMIRGVIPVHVCWIPEWSEGRTNLHPATTISLSALHLKTTGVCTHIDQRIVHRPLELTRSIWAT